MYRYDLLSIVLGLYTGRIKLHGSGRNGSGQTHEIVEGSWPDPTQPVRSENLPTRPDPTRPATSGNLLTRPDLTRGILNIS